MKKIIIGKIVFLFLVFGMSYRGNIEHYMDLSLFIAPLMFGTIIRAIYLRLVKNEKYRRYASLSFILFGVIWTLVLGFTQTGGTDMLEVQIWLPIFYGLLISIVDDMIFWKSLLGEEKPSRRKYMLAFLIAIFIVVMSYVNGFNNVVSYINAPSLVYILIMVIPMLLITDTFGDVVRGTKFVIKRKCELTTKELRAAKVGLKLVVWGVVIGCLLSVINMLPSVIRYSDSIELQVAYTRIIMITPLYGVIISGCVAMVSTIIEKEIVYRES